MYPAMRPPTTKGTLGQLELRLPPFPQTLIEAVEMMERPEEIEVRPVARMVERDPILVAQLLRTVNSAYYGLQRTITSPERAVVLLGPVTVVGLVAGMSMMRMRPMVTDTTSKSIDRAIAHSLATAYLTRFIVEGIPGHRVVGAYPSLARNGAAFTAGLLHDLGKFVLLYNFPEEATALYRDGALDALITPRDGCEYERLLFGCDHTEAGVVAAQHFSFPDALTDVVRCHHMPGALQGEGVTAETAGLLRATVAGSHMAKALGFGLAPGVDESGLTAPVWDEILHRDHPGLGSTDALLRRVQEEGPALRQYAGTLTASDPGTVERLRKQMRLIR